ncbi:unnamed protein product [Kluyveromyces dobzhanskii CBS 2104]|uniref:WGS project CCBQ000000000 data, contig 00098 n=1 Tax=Kluyveromyces dobzhanskii CBS 2104 TaxID=1427455 RepID=A0A0A8L3F3_9SACH|nr:unnamed protein product [Kluyveromyces dobzhanskii CBS 2104]
MAGVLGKIHNFLVLDESDRTSNKDLVPMPVSRRKWGIYGFTSYWTLLCLCMSTWSGGSLLLLYDVGTDGGLTLLGMNGRQTIGCIVLANFFVSVVTIVNSVYGSEYHIGYSVFQRIIFGMRGSSFGVLIRAILSVVWFASQAWLGGLCVNVIISSWSETYMNLPNTFPESVPMTRQELIGFVIYMVINAPILMVKPEYFDHILAAGSFCMFFVGLGITIWAVVDNGGSNGPLLTAKVTASSTDLGWAWITNLNAWYSFIIAGISNQSDFSRFNKRPRSAYIGILIGVNVMGIIIPLMGIVTASALLEKYGESFWMPNDICMFWMQQNYNAKSRAAGFFAGLGLLISQLGVNCISNAISGGMDLASIFPRYINIRRGSLLIMILAWPTQPWLFYNTTSAFLTVMSSFTVFITPLIAMFVCDYFVIRKGVIKLSDCYIDASSSIYWYQGGINWKNVVCFLCGSAPGLPGLIHSANPNIPISTGIYRFFCGSFIFQFAVTFALYFIINTIFKPEIGEKDQIDYYHTYTEKELQYYNMIAADSDDVAARSDDSSRYLADPTDLSLRNGKMESDEKSAQNVVVL